MFRSHLDFEKAPQYHEHSRPTIAAWEYQSCHLTNQLGQYPILG